MKNLLPLVLLLAACAAPDPALDPALHGATLPEQTNLPGDRGDLAVTTSQVSYYDGIRGFLAEPTELGDYPGVIMIHEWWGLNEHIEATASQLASHGYRVLAVDLFGTTATTPDQARAQVTAYDAEEGIRNLAAAKAYLEGKGAARVASLGWCFGGAQSYAAAKSLDLAASVIYYGSVDGDVAGITHPVMGNFGGEDGSIPVSDVDSFREALTAAGVENDVKVFDGAQHAFANPSGDRYDAQAAEEAWARTMRFLEATLAPAPDVTFSLTGENFAFFRDGEEAPVLRVKRGERVRIEFTSTSGYHDWVVDEFGAATTKVRDGGVTSVEFIADRAGEYEYYCSVGQHRANGMKGLLIVEE